MSTVEGGGNIITDGLVLLLDAANTKSYPTTGTVWSDLSRGNNNGTLINGPLFNSANGGSIVFDGVNDCVTTTCVIEAATSSKLQTFCSWLSGTPTNNSFFGSDADSGGEFHLILDFPTPTQLRFWTSAFGGVGGGADQTNIVTVTPNPSWNYGCIVKTAVNTFDVYFNGEKVISNANKTAFNPSFFNLGRFWINSFRKATIGITKIYNRALSAQEVLQNFNATRARFVI